jgi:biopolymer transport protein ExbB
MLANASKFYIDGGWWMHPIAVCSCIGFALALERFVQLVFRYNINSTAFMAQIQKLVMANNIDRAIKLCNTAPSAILPRVIKSALTRANKGEVEILSVIEETTLEVVPLVTRRMQLLPTVANIATLLGLLGTIVGLIDAFAAVASAPPDQKAQMLTAAIAIAMNTTAFGLIVAIPILSLYAYLNGLVKRLLDDLDIYSVKLANLLIARGKTQQTAA